jgi:hypothetical protein
VKPSFEADSPAPGPTTNPLNDTRTLEEILIGSPDTSSETNRYGEQEATDQGESTAEKTDADAPAESTTDEETEKPASETGQ